MTTSLFLTPDELRELTDSPQVSRQIAWLRTHGWRFELSLANRPKVARAYYERRVLGEAVTPAPTPKPKFEALYGPSPHRQPR